MNDLRPYPPTPEQRELGRRHVVFELQMLREVVRLHEDAIQREVRSRASMCLVSALRDSALVHARNLHDFFLRRDSRRDDIVVCDYLAGDDWLPEAELKTLAEDVPDINKFRGHLTYERTQRTRPWDIAVHLDEIEAAFQQFVERLPVAERITWRARLDDPDWRPTRGVG